jgi:flagellar hook-associated protein 3 FlgL
MSDLETLGEAYNRISRQVSSGKKLNQLKDSPSGCAELVSLANLESKTDRYQSNANASSLYLQVADSALNEVTNLVTSIYAKGSQASAELVNSDARAALASEVRSLRNQIVTLANSEARNRFLFAGSLVTSAPFSQNGDAITYNGDDTVSSINVDNGTEVQMNFSGRSVFEPIFNSINSLLAAMDSNDVAGIKTALEQFSSTLSGLGAVRAKVGTNMNLLQNIQSNLDSRETSLTEQRSKIEDADMVQAAVQLNQTKTALQTAMSAGGSILTQRNLFDILG